MARVRDGGAMDEATQRLLAARRRPDRRALLRQRWDQLFFLHWRVDPVAVARLLPPGLTPDLFEGETHLGIVGFRMMGIRPEGLPSLPWLSSFYELNVRVYVRDASGEPVGVFLQDNFARAGKRSGAWMCSTCIIASVSLSTWLRRVNSLSVPAMSMRSDSFPPAILEAVWLMALIGWMARPASHQPPKRPNSHSSAPLGRSGSVRSAV